jgi:hypothetical protein
MVELGVICIALELVEKLSVNPYIKSGEVIIIIMMFVESINFTSVPASKVVTYPLSIFVKAM